MNTLMNKLSDIRLLLNLSNPLKFPYVRLRIVIGPTLYC